MKGAALFRKKGNAEDSDENGREGEGADAYCCQL